MPRNPGTPHRIVKGNAARTQARKEQYYGIEALLQTWEVKTDGGSMPQPLLYFEVARETSRCAQFYRASRRAGC